MAEASLGRVLVVDDDDRVRRLTLLILKSKGYHTSEAIHGRQALERLAAEPIDLVVTDLKMPEMDGLELVEEAKTLYPETDFIVLTGYGTIQSAVYAIQRGAKDYMTKPFDVDELERKVAACFQARGAKKQSTESLIMPLLELSRILSSQMDLADTLDAIVELVKGTFEPAGTEVAVFEESATGGTIVVHSGRRPTDMGYASVDEEAVRREAAAGTVWVFREPGQDGAINHRQAGHGITVPLFSASQVVGALTLVRDPGSARFAVADAELLQVFGFQIGLSMLHSSTRQRLLDSFRDLEEANFTAVETLFEALRTYDQYTHDHSERVSRFSRLFGKRLGMDDRTLENLAIAGLLHDIGKLGVGDSTLNKNGALTSDELDRVKLHPVMGAKILGGLKAFSRVVPLVQYHHERYDGEGYPSGLSGDSIPLGARIISVVDSYDSMTSDRPYRRALGHAEAVERLLDSCGTQHDPELVGQWIDMLQELHLQSLQAQVAT